MKYPEYPDHRTQLEDAVLERWRADDVFARTLKAREGAPEFVFYEGPPTANGRPGLHHVVSRTLKDLVCRYQTMRGRHVTRIAGWDTHGLPVEIEAEKKLGISGKREIEEVGVARFNEVCRESVFTYKEEWERLSERIGYWLDYSKPYVTFHPEYVESVWWILKQLDERGLLYKGYKSVPYCPRCGTALSSHEVAQGYEDVEDPSLTFICPLLDANGEVEDRAIVAWTTTPWTLPSNVALAVHPYLEYVEVAWQGRGLIVAEARVEAVFGEGAEVRRRYRADELVGRRYQRPFELVPVPDDAQNAWQIVAEDFVSAEDGTGVVHLAPAFGSDDFAAGARHGLPMMRPVDDAGRFDEDLDLVGGLFVKDADPILVEHLERRGRVLDHGTLVHSYPHCWRCDSPLLYMARDSWYARTTECRDDMLANNAAIGWHPPEMGTGRMGEWLEGNVDWALSRDRFWGTPLPIWVCDADPSHTLVVGSFAELAEQAGPLADDFDPHKPFIDEVTWSCAECGGTMRRTPEVIDVWFDSGSMPFAQWHYPFENEDAWQRHFPADFICEGLDQTRGWFYSLLAISTMLGLGPAYRNVMVNGLLLDRDGQKMSKSRGNVVDPWDAVADFGADALRWYFVTVSQPWAPKRYDPDAVTESVRRTFNTLENTYRFFALYANAEDWTPGPGDPAPQERPLLDRWLRSRLHALVTTVTAALDAYDVTPAARAVGDFVVDDLSNWYIRRSRDRFYGSAENPDARAAFRTLHEALDVVARLLAPLTPFVADWLYAALGHDDSVHLAMFPEADAEARDQPLERGMDAARILSSLGRAAREKVRIRVRQPLRALHAALPDGRNMTPELVDLARDELNVKEIRFVESAGELVTLRGKPNYRSLGARFGKRTQEVADLVRAVAGDALQALRRGAPLVVTLDGQPVELADEDVEVVEEAAGELAVESGEGYTVALDPTLDDALRREGLARELVNRIQRFRRDLDLNVSDRIHLGVFGESEIVAAAQEHADYIARETLAVELEAEPDGGADYAAQREVELDGMKAAVALSVVESPDGTVAHA
jgi:isoleucyl-tRNA synthetase